MSRWTIWFFGRNRSEPEIRDDILAVIADLTEIARKL